MSIESVMPSNHLILCHPLLFLPSTFPRIMVFSNESALRIRWPKDWSFSFSISPPSEHSGLISFRMDWLDLLAVQEILKSLLQHQSSKASILRRSTFFIGFPCTCVKAAFSPKCCFGIHLPSVSNSRGSARPALGLLSLLPLLGPTLDHQLQGPPHHRHRFPRAPCESVLVGDGGDTQ